MDFDSYDPGAYYDELFAAPGQPRPGAEFLVQRLASLSEGELLRRQQAAERAFVSKGITFNVYGSEDGIEKVWPFDIIPRIVEAADWQLIERGLEQRLRALNLFIGDIYGPQAILRDGVIPEHVIHTAKGYHRACIGLKPPHGLWCHIAGIDLVRDGDGRFYVLEDNLRVPSGVSYMLSNRLLMMRLFPDLFRRYAVRPVEHYPALL